MLRTITVEKADIEDNPSKKASKKKAKDNNALPVPEKAKNDTSVKIQEGADFFLEFQGSSSIETEAWLVSIENAQNMLEHNPKQEYRLVKILEGPVLQGVKYCHDHKQVLMLQIDNDIFIANRPRTGTTFFFLHFFVVVVSHATSSPQQQYSPRLESGVPFWQDSFEGELFGPFRIVVCASR